MPINLNTAKESEHFCLKVLKWLNLGLDLISIPRLISRFLANGIGWWHHSGLYQFGIAAPNSTLQLSRTVEFQSSSALATLARPSATTLRCINAMQCTCTYWQLYNNIMKDGAEYAFRTFNKMVEYDILTLKVLFFRLQATHSLVERPKNWVFTLHWVQGGPSARVSLLTVPMGLHNAHSSMTIGQ